MDFIQINKFSKLHDNNKIIFCKTDYLNQEFNNIKKLINDVVLITGNSDYPITDDIVNRAPKNIKKWFAQNALSNSNIIEPLPIGIENKLPSLRDGHGVGYFERVKVKEELLSRHLEVIPTKFIYSNFNIHTNYNHRSYFKNKSLSLKHIDWEDNNLTLEEYFNKILNYKMVLCPIGNGIDTHRLWEVLYSGRVPITVKSGDYKIYELYEKLPIIVLNTIDELNDKVEIEKKYNLTLNKIHNKNELDNKFWENKILNA